MSWRNIKLIFLREVRDQLRDRRTLFMIAILPLLLYPSLGIGMVQMTMLFTEQPRTVVVLGADHLPQMPQLLDGDRIASTWFELPTDAEKLLVVTDQAPSGAQEQPDHAKRDELIAQSQLIRLRVEELEAMKSATESKPGAEKGESTTADPEEFKRLRKEIGTLFSDARMQVLIIVPEDFGKNVEETTLQLAQRNDQSDSLPDYPRPVIVRNSANEKSVIAYRRVKDALEAWEQEILNRRLQNLNLPESLPTPVNPSRLDLAEKDQIAANLWSKLFPALLVIMAVTGAFYPAVDLAAGEKERGTMETLLICPAKRSEIVVGKFFTVMLFSASTAILNLLSMGFTGKYMAEIAGSGALQRIGDLSLPPPMALLWVVVLLVPLAALFSALCLALATFARSSKEGQYYLAPLLTVTMGLTVFCLSPAVEIQPIYCIMPVVGPALLLKELLASPGSTEPLLYAVPVLVSSVGYSLLALWWAIEQFTREDVLFREAERFELGLWIRHLLRDKEATPSFLEAGFCFLIIMFLQFGAGRLVRPFLGDPTGELVAGKMMQVLMVQQLVTIACPALFMAILLTKSVSNTLRLRLPNGKVLAAALVLPLALQPLSQELAHQLHWFFPPLPKAIQDLAGAMADSNQPLWLVLLAFAATPAICEEVAFRGFILSGFSRSRHAWLAIVLSSLAFGAMHMIPQQVFNASLVGLVLGLIAFRGKSLIPCVLFHFCYNALGVMSTRVTAQPEWLMFPSADWFLTVGESGLRFGWVTLLLAALTATLLITWLVKHGRKSPHADEPTNPHADEFADEKAPAQPSVRI